MSKEVYMRVGIELMPNGSAITFVIPFRERARTVISLGYCAARAYLSVEIKATARKSKVKK